VPREPTRGWHPVEEEGQGNARPYLALEGAPKRGENDVGMSIFREGHRNCQERKEDLKTFAKKKIADKDTEHHWRFTFQKSGQNLEKGKRLRIPFCLGEKLTTRERKKIKNVRGQKDVQAHRAEASQKGKKAGWREATEKKFLLSAMGVAAERSKGGYERHEKVRYVHMTNAIC